MNYDKLKNKILAMKLSEKNTIYEINDDVEIFVNKPLEVPSKLKNSKKYDPQKNFQIGLKKKGQKEFLPNHLRILIDLQLKFNEDQRKALILLDAVEKIYEGDDPLKFKDLLTDLCFKNGFEYSFTDLCLAQLFFLEQDINYDFGNVQPPRAYLMGYIRMIRLGADEIDKLLWSSVRHPPRVVYRTKHCLN